MVSTLQLLVGEKRTLLGIEGNTALVGANESFLVVGSGGVVVWNKREKQRYTHGQPVSW